MLLEVSPLTGHQLGLKCRQEIHYKNMLPFDVLSTGMFFHWRTIFCIMLFLKEGTSLEKISNVETDASGIIYIHLHIWFLNCLDEWGGKFMFRSGRESGGRYLFRSGRSVNQSPRGRRFWSPFYQERYPPLIQSIIAPKYWTLAKKPRPNQQLVVIRHSRSNYYFHSGQGKDKSRWFGGRHMMRSAWN